MSAYSFSPPSSGSAFTGPFSDDYGFFESGNPSESFNLRSKVAASAWCGTQPFEFISYTYANGSFKEKASDTIDLSQGNNGVQTSDFANYGKDFKHIAAVTILSDHGLSSGSTCTYGSPTYGYQVAFDNMKVLFHGPIPAGYTGHRALLPIQMQHHAHHLAGVTALGHSNSQHSGFGHSDGTVHHTDGGYHSVLLTLHGERDHGLTSQFTQPTVEHFGT